MSAAPSAARLTDIPVVLLNLFLTSLAPMFGAAGNADPAAARALAFEMLAAFGVRDAMDLFTCTQMMGFGMVAMDSLNRSMTEGMSTATLVRLRGNAATMHRAAQQSHRVLLTNRDVASLALRPVHPSWEEPFDPAGAQDHAEAQLADVARLLAAMQAGGMN